MAHLERRKILLLLVTVVAAAFIWYYFSQIYGHETARPGTLVMQEASLL